MQFKSYVVIGCGVLVPLFTILIGFDHMNTCETTESAALKQSCFNLLFHFPILMVVLSAGIFGTLVFIIEKTTMFEASETNGE